MSTGKLTLESMSTATWYNKWCVSKFEKYLKGTILEVGFGIGNFTHDLVQYGEVYAVDIEEKYVKEAGKDLKLKSKIGFGDIEKGQYFFQGIKFNSIVCLNVLEHIKDDEKAIANLFNLLKPKGYLILIVPAHQFLYGEIDKSIDHYRRYEKKNLEKIIQKTGFEIVFSRHLNFLGAIGWFIAGKVFKDSTVKEVRIKIFNFFAPIFLKIEDFIDLKFGTSILLVAIKK